METPEYTQGIAGDGAAILRDGIPLTPEHILSRLRLLQELRAALTDAPELNPSNYDHEQVCELNAKVIDAWMLVANDDDV